MSDFNNKMNEHINLSQDNIIFNEEEKIVEDSELYTLHHTKELQEMVYNDIKKIGTGNEKTDKLNCEKNILFYVDIDKDESILLNPLIMCNGSIENRYDTISISSISSIEEIDRTKQNERNVLETCVNSLIIQLNRTRNYIIPRAKNAIINYARSKTLWRYNIEHKNMLNESEKIRKIDISEWKMCEKYSNLSYKYKKISEKLIHEIFISLKDISRMEKLYKKSKETNEIPLCMVYVWPPYVKEYENGNLLSTEVRRKKYFEKENKFIEVLKNTNFTDTEIKEYLDLYDYEIRDGWLRNKSLNSRPGMLHRSKIGERLGTEKYNENIETLNVCID